MNAARKSPAASKTPRLRTESSLITHLQDVVHELVMPFGGVTRRTMFASDGWFVNEKVFTLVSKDGRIIVRLPDPAAQDELLSLPGASMWQIPSRPPMRGWLELPETMHDDDAALRVWLRRAANLAAALPAKKVVAKKKTGVPKALATSARKPAKKKARS
jgi:TfoX/Sxy family transcriptional regulator of competence genes